MIGSKDPGVPATQRHKGSTSEPATSSPTAAPPGDAWWRWIRPAASLALTVLLGLCLFPQLDPIRPISAMAFLLLSPGLALQGFKGFRGWPMELSMAMGISVALATLLALATLYAGIWSADLVLAILVALSAGGSNLQLIRTLNDRRHTRTAESADKAAA